MYREKMFDKLIARIDKTEGRLVIHEGRYNPQITAETDCLVPFPEKLCQTEKDKKSVLVHLACDDASAWLHEILKYVLAGKFVLHETCQLVVLEGFANCDQALP